MFLERNKLFLVPNLMKMPQVYIIIGSNLGNREFNIVEAEKLILQKIGDVVKSSHLYETEPWGASKRKKFLNKALIVETNLKPYSILEQSQTIEKYLGREHNNDMKPRIIDIDILFIDNLIMNDKSLTVPHPLIAERNFVLVPLSEICRDFVHPVFNKTIGQLLNDCQDKLDVKKLEQV